MRAVSLGLVLTLMGPVGPSPASRQAEPDSPAAPPTDAPPTDAPPTDAPPTDAPPTDAPPTDAPPTDAPPTDAPPTDAAPTDEPADPPSDAPSDAPADAPPTDEPASDATEAEPPTDEPPSDVPPEDPAAGQSDDPSGDGIASDDDGEAAQSEATDESQDQDDQTVDEPDPWADRPEEPTVAGKPRTGKGMMIAGGTVLGAGLAASITFGLMTRGCRDDGPLQCRYQDSDRVLIPLGVVVGAVGAMLLSVGAGYHVHYKKWERWTPSRAAYVAPSIDPRGGAGLVYGARF